MTMPLREIALANFQGALSQAVDLIAIEGEDLDRRLFPLWRDALHDTLTQYAVCVCGNTAEACGLNWPQRSRIPDGHSLSYARFRRAFDRGCALALEAMSTDTGTH